jgi:hypothetical protein
VALKFNLILTKKIIAEKYGSNFYLFMKKIKIKIYTKCIAREIFNRIFGVKFG